MTKNDISFRNAKEHDCKLVYDWQISPGIRQYCRVPDAPTCGEHNAWFSQLLSDDSRELFIIEYGGVPIGVIRLDQLEKSTNKYEISILIASIWQGKGLAKISLKAFRLFKPELVLFAEIMKSNIPSIRAFCAAGFKKKDQMWYVNDNTNG